MNILEGWHEFVERVRRFFRSRGYLEVSTAVLLRYPNLDANIEPIKVKLKLKGRERTFWLQTSPEYSMKKLLALHKRSIFQVAKVFRDGEYTPIHRPEFHMLEWYKIGEDYRYLINEIKDLLKDLFGVEEFREIPLGTAFEEFLGIRVGKDEDSLKEALSKAGIHFEESDDWETLFFRAYIELERKLNAEVPTFLYDFPKPLCALAKIRGNLAERFELFYKGVELANGWTEETDPEEVRSRLMREAKRRNLPLDEEFINAHRDIPPCSGCSIGLDRLFMLWIGVSDFDTLEKKLFYPSLPL